MNLPDRARLADARRRAAFAAEHVPGRSNLDDYRVVAFDVLAEFCEDIYTDSPKQLAWALRFTEQLPELRPHEARLREDAWQKINDDADRAQWERLGLRR